MYPDYPDPMPAFQFNGGASGKALLESALAEPQQTFGGVYLHRTVFDKAAALYRSVVKNHALLDGNKRLGLTTAAVFLWLNGYLFSPAYEDAVSFTVRIATGEVSELPEIARWLRRNSKRTSELDTLPSNELAKMNEATPGFLPRFIVLTKLSVQLIQQDLADRLKRLQPTG